jgi:hypothetical protein
LPLFFGSIGTPTQLSVAKYLNDRKIPQLFIDSGAYRWGNYKDTPYTIGGVRPTYRLGARPNGEVRRIAHPPKRIDRLLVLASKITQV